MSFADGLKNLKSLVRDTGESSAERHERRIKDFQRRLRRAGEKVRERLLLRPPATPPPPGERVLAVLLLIIDSLPYEEHWREWAGQDGGVKVRFWIHAKHPDRVKSSWARGRLIRRSFRPEWGSIEIVRAELELLQVAVAESSAQRLLLASETCVPIVPLARAAEVVFEKECSWVNARSTPNNGYSTAAQFDPPEQAGIPRDLIWKADQWCLLTRRHAKAILELPREVGEDLWPYFKKGLATDEMYLSTCLGAMGELREGGGQGQQQEGEESTTILRRRVTFCRWGLSPKNPETFQAPLSPEMLRAAREEGCLVARKFAPGAVSLEVWRSMMEEEGGGGAEGKEEEGGEGGKEEGEGQQMVEDGGGGEGGRAEKRAREEEAEGGEEQGQQVKRLQQMEQQQEEEQS